MLKPPYRKTNFCFEFIIIIIIFLFLSCDDCSSVANRDKVEFKKIKFRASQKTFICKCDKR